MQNKANLLKIQINAIPVFTKDYEVFVPYNNPKNKPNQSQFAKRPKMNVSIYYIKVYKNETAFRRGKNKPNQSQIFYPQRGRKDDGCQKSDDAPAKNNMLEVSP